MIELALRHKAPFEKVAEWTALAPARRFGLGNRKGQIKIGCDADFAIVSLNETYTVTKDSLFAKHKESLYEEHVFPCRITGAFNRGRLVFDGSDTRGAAGGTWLNEREAKAGH